MEAWLGMAGLNQQRAQNGPLATQSLGGLHGSRESLALHLQAGRKCKGPAARHGDRPSYLATMEGTTKVSAGKDSFTVTCSKVMVVLRPLDVLLITFLGNRIPPANISPSSRISPPPSTSVFISRPVACSK